MQHHASPFANKVGEWTLIRMNFGHTAALKLSGPIQQGRAGCKLSGMGPVCCSILKIQYEGRELKHHVTNSSKACSGLI